MKISVVTATIRDSAAIDIYLSGKQNSSPYQHLQWLIAIKEAYGHDYYYLLAKSDTQIVGVLPLCLFKNLRGKLHICSLPFCDVGGAVSESEEIKSALIEYALKHLGHQYSAFLEIRQLSTGTKPIVDLTGRKVSMMLKLPDDADTLFKSFKSKLRSQIRKSEKNGLTFDYSDGAIGIEEFYKVFSRNMHKLGSPTHSKRWFHALREFYQDELLVGRVCYGDKTVGAGILLFSGQNVSVPWASTLKGYNKLAPNMMLYWNLLRLSCERGCKLFDFGRSTYAGGTYKFKHQWGAEPVLLDWQYLDKNGKPVSFSSPGRYTRHLIEFVWKNMPLLLANIIGPRLRKHISL